MSSNFFSMISRMKYINRWGLMRNTRQENLSEHALEVAMIAHALGVIANTRLGKSLDTGKLTVFALYHDASEIITGDLPTPIKYYNSDIKKAYKIVEDIANQTLLNKLPTDMIEAYYDVFIPSKDDEYLWKLIKGADKLSALIKCVEEENSGNTEFCRAHTATMAAVNNLDLPEVQIFMQEFYDGFTKTLDEQ